MAKGKCAVCGDPTYQLDNHLPVCGRCFVCPNCESTTRNGIYYDYTTGNWVCEWCNKNLGIKDVVIKEINKYWMGRANQIIKHQKE